MKEKKNLNQQFFLLISSLNSNVFSIGFTFFDISFIYVSQELVLCIFDSLLYVKIIH